jgi:hypothetical protein
LTAAAPRTKEREGAAAPLRGRFFTGMMRKLLRLRFFLEHKVVGPTAVFTFLTDAEAERGVSGDRLSSRLYSTSNFYCTFHLLAVLPILLASCTGSKVFPNLSRKVDPICQSWWAPPARELPLRPKLHPTAPRKLRCVWHCRPRPRHGRGPKSNAVATAVVSSFLQGGIEGSRGLRIRREVEGGRHL